MAFSKSLLNDLNNSIIWIIWALDHREMIFGSDLATLMIGVFIPETIRNNYPNYCITRRDDCKVLTL
jgi:hypothetical protein